MFKPNIDIQKKGKINSQSSQESERVDEKP